MIKILNSKKIKGLKGLGFDFSNNLNFTEDISC